MTASERLTQSRQVDEAQANGMGDAISHRQGTKAKRRSSIPGIGAFDCTTRASGTTSEAKLHAELHLIGLGQWSGD